MTILTGSNIKKSYGGRVLFSGVTFKIGNRDCVGLVGANGAGKTTLFRIITGGETCDEGGVVKAAGLTVGHLAQHVCADSDRSALDETLEVFRPLIETEKKLAELQKRLHDDHSAETIELHARLTEEFQRDGGLTYLARAKSALKGLGFSEAEILLPISALSGGQKSKIGLCRLLLSSPRLMLLDEPTNHLDIDASEWLEDYIRGYSGAALIISHDRYFLDRVTNRTFEMEHGRLFAADGNYSRYKELKEERLYSESRQYDNTMREIKRIEGIIKQQRQWNRERNIKTAESKQKQVDKLAAGLQKPEREPDEIKYRFEINLTGGNDVLSVKNLSKAFPGRVLYKNVEMDIKRGQKLFLIGANGCGKTTFLKQLLSVYENNEESDSNIIRFGSGVAVGYFDQTGSTLDEKKTVLHEVWGAYPDMLETAVRNALAVFLFRGDGVYQPVSELSGGERARVAIVKLMLSRCNLLLLDEPTNHLDIYSREALEKALKEYPGSLLAVSHDRYFINKLADRICRLTPEGIEYCDGDYDRYLEIRNISKGFP
ncbi:MAG: ATP-binding cassette domain-containing protein, partial [Oscillospiraceae bacterium]|nr:ATP-binding cassette domain-containing protein [Oscillospiraceae bacterium]